MNAILRRTALLSGFCVLSLVHTLQAGAQERHEKKAADTALFHEKFRPQYHLTPIRGWVNDPTALVYLNGLYQVNKRLAVSKDLIHWQREERPGRAARKDSVGEMSGSAVIDSNNTSGFGINGKPPLVSVYSGLRYRDIRQFQCISYSNDDGKTWIKYDKNPVIDIGSTEFRDPQVFWYQPEQKWVMVVAWADERKIRFYSSPDLKNWQFLSDFGPAGADNGVWECPDFFPLPVDGNLQNIKWVLETSVQPAGGQYFIGSFDGKTFVADRDFNLQPRENRSEGDVLFDFEKGLPGWKVAGTAFNASPSEGRLPMQGAVLKYEGKKLINSFFNGDSSIGEVISPPFTITKDYLNFLVGGGADTEQLSIDLIVNNKRVRTATGTNTEVLHWDGWHVAELIGETASIAITDHKRGGYGHILVDQVTLSDKPASNPVPEAFWIDYGPDFYAVRSWVNGPKNDNRRIWSAWMSNWLYASEVPTRPWKGIHTFPRTVALKTFPEGIRMVQQPITEIKMLRDKHFDAKNTIISAPAPIGNLRPKRNSYELQVEIDPGKSKEVGLFFCVGDSEKTVVSYDIAKQILRVDRTHSGNTSFSKFFPGIYTAPLKLNSKGKISLRVLVDQCSLEVFGNEGEATITCQIFPAETSTGLQIYAKDGLAKLLKMDAWELKPFWTDQQ